MASEAKKVKTKAKINWGWDAPEDRRGKATRGTSRKIKKIGLKAILIIMLVTVIGGTIGAGACYFVCRNDCFNIIGQEEITLTLLDEGHVEYNSRNSYVDEGVNIVSFGRDVSHKVYIETNLKQTNDGKYYADEIGTYYIIYKVDDIKYGKIFTVQRIRLITFVEGSESDVVD
ncbi:MAG: hypothetical protein J6Q15_01460 [Clostridia bacterium]|nr:hypothetical protein [Clostridia bacterium]